MIRAGAVPLGQDRLRVDQRWQLTHCANTVLARECLGQQWLVRPNFARLPVTADVASHMETRISKILYGEYQQEPTDSLNKIRGDTLGSIPSRIQQEQGDLRDLRTFHSSSFEEQNRHLHS